MNAGLEWVLRLAWAISELAQEIELECGRLRRADGGRKRCR
jgi:hypothetical protein